MNEFAHLKQIRYSLMLRLAQYKIKGEIAQHLTKFPYFANIETVR